MLTIRHHRLAGERVVFQATPNLGGALAPRFLVFHYTAGGSAASAITTLCTRKPRGNTSAHLVLARDGAITQLAPFDRVTWHAGTSQWMDVVGLNQASIGIEIDNAGPLSRVGERYLAWFGREVPADEVMLAAHKHGGPVRPWHAYTALQIERCLELTDLLVAHYGLTEVLGHDDIARGRKLDPGPAFPLGSIVARVLGRGDDAPPRYRVTARTLNIRKGPDAAFDAVAPPLARGTVVSLLEPGHRWSRVEVDGPTDVEGWVNNLFIEPLPTPRAAPPRGARKAARQASPRKAAGKAAHHPAAASRPPWRP